MGRAYDRIYVKEGWHFTNVVFDQFRCQARRFDVKHTYIYILTTMNERKKGKRKDRKKRNE